MLCSAQLHVPPEMRQTGGRVLGKQGCSFSLTSSLHSELDSSVLTKIQVCLFWV